MWLITQDTAGCLARKLKYDKTSKVWLNIELKWEHTRWSSWKSYSAMQHYQKSTGKIPLKNHFVIAHLILKSFVFFFHWRAGTLKGHFFMFKVGDPMSVQMTFREWKGKDHVNAFCFIIINISYQVIDIFINNWYFL